MEKKASRKNGILRLVFAAIAILLEGAFLLVILYAVPANYAEAITIISRALAFILVLAIYSQKKTGSIKMPWMILILTLPVVGLALYLLIGLSGSTRRMRKRYEKADAELFTYLKQDEDILKRLEAAAPSCCSISRYLLRQAGYPVFRGTKATYYRDAADGLEAQKKALRNAKHFIFMEYYAIEDSVSWQSVEEILEQKARDGVEVRVFYDDIGSIGYVNLDFVKKLEQKGIRCRAFNPMMPILNMFLNNRDHRKMTIVDGRIGFTGGYNMADEYFNITSPYGHWKDTGLRLEGDAVRSMTVTFLEMWNAVRSDDRDDGDMAGYLPEAGTPLEKAALEAAGTGYVQFYADNPMDQKAIGEDVYISMISRAQRYLYLMTPYLIITDEMSHALGLAAKRGVDVRIVTPGIPDKKLVYQLTRSFYHRLTSDGVRIFEYTPGFCHAKMCVSDDIAATCGTINLDYRSLYHHFEDGCFLIGNEAVTAIRDDFLDTFLLCEEVTEKYRSGRSAVLRVGQLVLRLFAPLL